MKLDTLLIKKKNLKEQADLLFETIKNDLDLITSEIEEIEVKIKDRIGTTFEEMRKLSGKELGVINIAVDGVHVKQTIPKKVQWDQDKMESIYNRIEAAGKDPNEYMNVTYSVYETDYKKYDPAVKSIFEPARTVIPENPTIKFMEE